MKIQMIGHASIFVETQDCKVMMDPVLWDKFCEVTTSICPEREVIYDQIPEYDVLVISHRHLDHFDIRSLAYLPKNVDVFIPKDQLIENCLRQLGYSHIYTLSDFSEVKIGSTTLLATRSENRVPEYGMVFADPSGVFWNQVDSLVNANTINFVKSQYPTIDFLLACWQPMLETEYQYNQSCAFPFSGYSYILQLMGLTQPRAISPGANGFKFIDGSAWLNKVVFPVTQEQFCQDIKKVCPATENIFALQPGDICEIENGTSTYLPAQSQFVKTVKDDRNILSFSPVTVNGEMIDSNPNNYDIHEVKRTIEEEVCVNLPKFIMEHKQDLFAQYFHWEVRYQLEVIFPDGSQTWYFDFTEDPIQCRTGSSPLANVFNVITASSLYALLKSDKTWDYPGIGGYVRAFEKIYIASTHGAIRPDIKSLNISPLALKFPYEEVFKKVLNKEVEKWSKQSQPNQFIGENQSKIMKLGNSFIRMYPKNINNQQLITTSV
ncbi:MBL fold metallo-hydrolase [Nostoc sp. FACHB-87]|uniref:MBL fold metallo-hydrolase n=1 Tax=Nostocaceae TaxID=1162 RepID=UPI0016852F45|nr:MULTISPECIES: MBL fold metallo-hydrolase [Nostocaceae]MBD2299677.1 MBL fold metallo-hydrolase [Nostoc sp. FACHB-190]MBD2457475.1 MBL fold metallo-hydrolase [Nostoc sp. FACHB-87]MBD2477557.1 MBL fold metallo-hydrolase [Anabaena sp. FACHB-83]